MIQLQCSPEPRTVLGCIPRASGTVLFSPTQGSPANLQPVYHDMKEGGSGQLKSTAAEGNRQKLMLCSISSLLKTVTIRDAFSHSWAHVARISSQNSSHFSIKIMRGLYTTSQIAAWWAYKVSKWSENLCILKELRWVCPKVPLHTQY